MLFPNAYPAWMSKTVRFQFRNLLTTLVVTGTFLAFGLLPGAMRAQDTSAAAASKTQYDKVLGAVVSVSSDGKSMTVKSDAGTPTEVLLDPETSYMRVPPGEKDLRKATRIELKDIAPGDRVFARSRKVEGQGPSPAVSVIVMSQSELAQHQEKTRAEWQSRGAAGKVTAIDPAAKTITITVAGKPLTVQTDDKTNFRRYAPDSVKFSDATPGKYGDVEVGNNLRVLGNKDADGASIHAEEVISGAFRTLAGTVISVDAAASEIKINELQSKKPLTIKINADSNLRKLPAQMAMMIAARANQNSAGAPAGQNVQGGADSKPGFNGPGTAAAPGVPGAGAGRWQGGPGGPGGAGGAGGGRMDLNRALEHAPQFQVADLKPGDALLINSTSGTDPARVTAITVVAGVEPMLAAVPSGAARGRGSQSAVDGMWNLGGEGGLPQQ
jgi:hypothetical protein